MGGVAGRVGMEARHGGGTTRISHLDINQAKVKDPGPSRSHITMSGCFGKAEPCVSIHSRIWRRDPVHSDTTREGPRAAVRIPARVSRVGTRIMDGGMEMDATRTLYKVPTILAMEGTTSSRRTMDAETLATEADQEVEGGLELLRIIFSIS